MKVAALDLGSNTFLCLIAEVRNGNIREIYHDSVEIVRLGQGLSSSKNFHDEALQRAEACLTKFSNIISEHKPDTVLAMATSAARDAQNKERLFEIAKRLNIPLEIIPGELEAAITYSGSVSGIVDKNKNLLVVDIGGGSTELIAGLGENLIYGTSLDIGCVRLTEKFISNQPTESAEIENVVKHIDAILLSAKEKFPKNLAIEEMLAVAGTPTSLAAAELKRFDVNQIDGYEFTENKLEEWLTKTSAATVEEKIKMGIPAGRADVILIGIIILIRTLKVFNLKKLKVSTRGVRYGVALEAARRLS